MNNLEPLRVETSIVERIDVIMSEMTIDDIWEASVAWETIIKIAPCRCTALAILHKLKTTG
ncbi:MAG: hypothetical protein FWG40_01045 [Peptococcaceae bacterium]|nr:hypothetical protein [Peptococcaceae bacterium]